MQLFLASLLWGLGCGTTGQVEVSTRLVSQGEAARAVQVGEVSVLLSEAKLALGPVYFCATAAASSSLCSIAVAEMRDTVVIDALNPTPVDLAAVRGVSGEIRSAQYDFGVSWFAASPEPAPTLEGLNSLVLRGTLTQTGEVVAFTAVLDVLATVQGERAIQGARVKGTLGAATKQVTVKLDPQAWLQNVPWNELMGQGAEVVANESVLNALRLQVSVNAAPMFVF